MIDINAQYLGNNNYVITETHNDECKVKDKLTEKDIKEINERKIPGTKIIYFY